MPRVRGKEVTTTFNGLLVPLGHRGPINTFIVDGDSTTPEDG